MQQLVNGGGPRKANAETQTTSDSHLRIKLAIQQLKAVDSFAFCQHDSCIDAPYASSGYCRTHLEVPSKDAAFCSSCRTWHPPAHFPGASRDCIVCESAQQAERMERKRKHGALSHQEPDLSPVLPSSNAAQQQPPGLPYIPSSSTRSSVLTAETFTPPGSEGGTAWKPGDLRTVVDGAAVPHPSASSLGAAAAAAAARLLGVPPGLPVSHAGRYMLHQDSVASTSARTGGMAPPTAAAAAGHPVMGPPAHLEDLLPQGAPSMPPPWVPAAGTEAQEGAEQQQQQQLSDQEQGALGSLALLANAAACAAGEPALKPDRPQPASSGAAAGHQTPIVKGGLTAHPWHPLGGNKVDRGTCCWRPGCGRPGQQAQQGRKVRLCELCYNYISDWADMDGGPPLWGWYNTNKRDVVAARQPDLDPAAWAAVDALLQKRRVSSGFITRKRTQSIEAGKPYAAFWDKQPYLQGLDSLLSGLGVQRADLSSKPTTPQQQAFLRLLELPAGAQRAGQAGGGGASTGHSIGPGAAGRAAAAAAAPPTAAPPAAAAAGGGSGGVPQAGEVMVLQPTGTLPEGVPTSSTQHALQQQVVIQVEPQMLPSVKAALATAQARNAADQ